MCFSSEVEIEALAIVSQFVSPEQCKLLIRNSCLILRVILNYRNARRQTDHRYNCFDGTLFEASHFLKILKNLAAADESVAEMIIFEEGLEEISAAIQMDPNSCIEGVDFFWEVLYGTEILWYILFAENGKHVFRTRLERCLLAGIHNISIQIYS